MQHYHRGERRYQRRRLIVKFTEQEMRGTSCAGWDNLEWAKRRALFRVQTRCICSCQMCRNQRHVHHNGKAGLTFQEIRFLQCLKDEE